MRSGAVAGHTGYFHETAFYGSDDELLALVVPFLTGGVEAGEPTLVAFGETNARLLRSALDDTSGITFLPGQYAKPAQTIRAYREILARHVADGAHQIRIVGDVPHPGTGTPWEWWGRYEYAVNQAFGEFPLWGLCPYDTRITPSHVLDDVVRTHPFIASVGANPRYGEGPIATERLLSPVESQPPTYELLNPTPAQARAVTLKAGAGLPASKAEDIVFAASEAVTNAVCHGVPPVRLRLWSDHSQVVVAVTDQGKGPRDPSAGLVPASSSSSAGLGLYLTHLMCDFVSMTRDDDGFTVRILMG